MEEIRIPVLLCDYLNSMPSRGGIRFVPEVWREGEAAVWLTGGVSAAREYIDGSAVVSVPFEIRLRCGSASVGERLDAISFFSSVEDFVRAVPVVLSAGESGSVTPVGGAFKSAILENGDEEYRAAYTFSYFRKA